MNQTRSFRPSDFTFRELPGLLIPAFLILSAFSVGLGLLLESASPSWKGLLVGAGAATLILVGWFCAGSKPVDASTLPEPSETVRTMLDAPGASVVHAVKAYRQETGRSLAEAKAAVDRFRERCVG